MKKLLLSWVFSHLLSSVGFAFEPFQVQDIRVEGLQRTEAGTVFSYLPLKIGDTVDEARASAAVRALFATGFFRNVQLEADGNVLVVIIEERPAIAQIEIDGSKEFDEKQLKEALKRIGLAESRIFDRALLELAEQELKSQYIGRGKYGVTVTSTVTPQERNRVAINFRIFEGEIASIRQIDIVGNALFPDDDLLEQFVLRTPGLLTWYSKNDQYSKPKLQADLENLRSFYQNQGFVEFNIDSTQVSISPDKKDIFITVNISEGEKFRVGEIKLAGELIVPEAELLKLVKLRRGEVFSREKLTETAKLITDRLGDEGYAFASVNPVPEFDRKNNIVSFTVYLDPGRRVYVRRINIAGNSNTRDEVIRREMRQMEGAWYSTAKLDRSKQRIDKLGFFSEVQMSTPAVATVSDQVDVEVRVAERATGSLTAGFGYSSTERVILSAGLSQNNIFGTGNSLAFQINTGSINRTYSLSYTNPYFTDDGVSRGIDLYQRDVDVSQLTAVGSYSTATIGGGLRFGVPVTEYDVINYGLALERTQITLFPDASERYLDFVEEFGEKFNTVLGSVGWARDKRDSVIYPTQGFYQRLSGEAGLPAGDLTYYRLNYVHQWYYPIGGEKVFYLNGQLGYASGYDEKPLPFYKVFYLGGVNSLRGYQPASLGPKDAVGGALGGSHLGLVNAEILFPLPGLEKDKSVRMSLFVDGGVVGDSFDFGEARFSAGLAFYWFSPVGPIRLSYGKALNATPDDRLQAAQFSLGTAF
ncbi:MAG: outer membrane protein assembly factor BamA [Burkholderiales bacterium]